MALQLDWAQNIPYCGDQNFNISNATVSFVPFNIYESISWGTLNLHIGLQAQNFMSAGRLTALIGLYSKTGSTLTITNSVSGTYSFSNVAAGARYVSFTATSASQNLTPGTWFIGLHLSTTSSANMSLIGNSRASATDNAFPNDFVGGRMTVSTNALPASVATSDLDTTGVDAHSTPYMLITA